MSTELDGKTDPHIALDPDTKLALHGERTGDELVAAVLAEPDSDDPRLVYGDYLIDRGDPRGELIQLQLARWRLGHDPTQRELELLAAHLPAWTAPLTPGLDLRSVRFERGFLTCCRVSPSLALRDLVGHPMWGTVEDLMCDDLALSVNACMRAMRRLRTRVDILGRLAGVSHRVPLERAELSQTWATTWPRVGMGVDLSSSSWADVLEVGALTELRELAIGFAAEPAPDLPLVTALLASPLGQRLVTLELRAPDLDRLGAWAPILLAHPSLRRIAGRISRFHGEERYGRVVLERTDRDEVDVVVELHEPVVPLDPTLAAVRSTAEVASGRLVVAYRSTHPVRDAALVAAVRARVSWNFPTVTGRPSRPRGWRDTLS